VHTTSKEEIQVFLCVYPMGLKLKLESFRKGV